MIVWGDYVHDSSLAGSNDFLKEVTAPVFEKVPNKTW